VGIRSLSSKTELGRPRSAATIVTRSHAFADDPRVAVGSTIVRITVLAGGTGGARFLRGVRQLQSATDSCEPIIAIVNTADDVTIHGLRICPDLDSVMYSLGEAIDPVRGWGRRDETWRIKEELALYGAEASWFGLGDLDLATHLIRTRMLDAGYPLSDVTTALCDRWKPGVRILPMTDGRSETHVVVEIDGQRRAIHFQEWWIRLRAKVPAESFVQVGIEDTTPGPGVLEAIATADVVLVAPSNPVVSIGPILAVPGIRAAIAATSAPVIGISPIIGTAPVHGMADACLATIGVEVSAQGVATHYGARSEGGLMDGWLVHETDTAFVPGMQVRPVPLYMSDDEATAQMVRDALELAGV
jgi:LPPG:FO 2-phospho-L-lactate transferase